MKKSIIRKAAAVALAVMLLISAVSCREHTNSTSDSTPESPSEMAYPLLTERWYNANGEQESEDIYTYGSKGRLNSSQYRDGESTFTSDYRYKNGKLVRKTEKYEYREIKKTFEYQYKYDANGRLEEIAKTADGKNVGKTSYLRDGIGQIKRVIYYNESGGFDGMVEHKYDTKGNCIEEKEYDAQNMTSKRIYEYNEAGSVTKCTVLDRENLIWIYQLSYDRHGQLTRCKLNKNGFTTQITEYEEVDNNGKCIKASIYDNEYHPEGWREYTYGIGKVPAMGWEFKECPFHGEFVP